MKLKLQAEGQEAVAPWGGVRAPREPQAALVSLNFTKLESGFFQPGLTVNCWPIAPSCPPHEYFFFPKASLTRQVSNISMIRLFILKRKLSKAYAFYLKWLKSKGFPFLGCPSRALHSGCF